MKTEGGGLNIKNRGKAVLKSVSLGVRHSEKYCLAPPKKGSDNHSDGATLRKKSKKREEVA